MTTPYAPSSISLSQVQAEFGGTNPISLSEYYSNDSYVSLGMPGIPSNGTISMGQLRNKNGQLGAINNNSFGAGVTYIDYTLPAERVWVQLEMLGGGGGGGNGDGAVPGANGGSGGYVFCIVRLPNTTSTKTLRVYRGFPGTGGNYTTVGGPGTGGAGYAFSNGVLTAANGGNGGYGGTSGGSGQGGGGGGMTCALYWDNADGVVIPIVAAAGGGGAGGAGQGGGERRGNKDHTGFLSTSSTNVTRGYDGASNTSGDNGSGGGGGGGGGAGGDFISYTEGYAYGSYYRFPSNETSGYGGNLGSPQYNPSLTYNLIYYGWTTYNQSYLGLTTNSGSGGAAGATGLPGQVSVAWSSQVPAIGTYTSIT